MADDRWSPTRANAWYAQQPWLVGCNFIPSSAVNQLEMWQPETFDGAGIDRELGFAAGLGFNTVRVYLHDLCWQAHAEGFKSRVDHFLSLASRHGIRPLFVVFDDCWYEPQPGPQLGPVPGVHNSRWAQSPGRRVVRDRRQWGRLEAYVTDVLRTFGGDGRVLAWDLYNEVTNDFLPVLGLPHWLKPFALLGLAVRRMLRPGPSLALLEETFRWARAAKPEQPLTAGVWFPDRRQNALLVGHSDVVSFHNYRPAGSLERQIGRLRSHGRPLLCTEYMARTAGSRFETHLPIFQRERVACYNWGLVDGRTQTRFSWRSRPGASEPDPWFHDILRADGSPYRPEEVEFIRALTGRGAARASPPSTKMGEPSAH